MAESVQIQGSEATGKVRNPLGVVALGLVTFGIYVVVWFYKTNKELAELGRAHNTEELGTSPGKSLLAMTLGVFLLVPPFVSMYRTWQRLNAAERLTGQVGTEAGLGFLLTILLGPVGHYMFQANLNKVLQVQAGALPSGAPLGSLPPGMAPVPTTQGTPGPPAGWYADPQVPGQQRYWSGSAWSDQTQVG